MMLDYFNPRSHTGSDGIATVPYHKKEHFNPRSHTGSDCEVVQLTPDYIDFNPRSHTGSDLTKMIVLSARNNFNPRSHTGSDSNIIQKFRIFSFICDNYKYTLHFYASFCECIIPHNKKYAAYIWCESHRYFMCACHSHSTCYKTRG